MQKPFERELSIMRTYYQYMIEHETGFKKEYYKGKLEATELIERFVILNEKSSIGYYEDFLKKKGIIRGCFNCAKNPLINPEIPDLPGCGEDDCHEPGLSKWSFKEMK